MRSAINDAFHASWPLATVVAIYIAILCAIQRAWSIDALGVLTFVAAIAAVVFGILVTVYLSVAKKSRAVAAALYALMLFAVALWLSSRLDAELGYGDFFATLIVALLVYGTAAFWTLASPRFVRLSPAALLTLIALFVLHAKRA